MELDAEIYGAIRKAVAKAGQDERLAQQLIAWFKALQSGSLTADDWEAATTRLELLYSTTNTEEKV